MWWKAFGEVAGDGLLSTIDFLGELAIRQAQVFPKELRASSELGQRAGYAQVQVDQAGSAIRDCTCSNSESIQSWARGSSRHLVSASHYRNLRASAFSEWSRALESKWQISMICPS